MTIWGLCWGHIGIMEKKVETTMVHWRSIGIMEKEMETQVKMGRGRYGNVLA